MPENILITGASGLIGTYLTDLLSEKNYKTAILTRKKQSDKKILQFEWDYQNNYIVKEALEFADIIIHLAGANISEKRWTDEQKILITDSRIKTAELIENEIRKMNKKLKAFISASAVGFYGSVTNKKIYTEEDNAGNDFLAEVVVKWEKAADNFKEIADRVVKLRLGIVLSDKGGALSKLINIAKKGFASPVGSGKQFMPWISIDDISRMFLFAVENNIEGVYNAVSSQHITNEDFMKILAKKMNKPYFMPKLPSFVLKTMFGQMASILLEGSRVSNEKITKAGFEFQHTELSDFLESIF